MRVYDIPGMPHIPGVTRRPPRVTAPILIYTSDEAEPIARQLMNILGSDHRHVSKIDAPLSALYGRSNPPYILVISAAVGRDAPPVTITHDNHVGRQLVGIPREHQDPDYDAYLTHVRKPVYYISVNPDKMTPAGLLLARRL